jgi:hypothetical protein
MQNRPPGLAELLARAGVPAGWLTVYPRCAV